MRRISDMRVGFTLTEIAVVLLLLAILALIIVPQFSHAGSASREERLHVTLSNLRGQIQLYRMQHGNQLPDLASGWGALTQTDSFGKPSESFGPYLEQAPVNPFNGRGNVIDATADGAAPVSCGFVYDFNHGQGSGRIFATDEDGCRIAGTGTFGANDFLAY